MEKLFTGPLSACCYIIPAPDGKNAVLVDPGGEPEKILSTLHGRRVLCVFLTHGHFDHTGAASEIKNRTGAPIYIHPADIDRKSVV